MTQRPEDFPIITGSYQLTKDFSIDLQDKEFRRRFEEDTLVIWRPGISLWIDAYGFPKDRTREEFIQEISNRDQLPSDTTVIESKTQEGFAYVFKETEDGKERWSLQTFTFGILGQVLMSIYFDKEEDLDLATKLWESIKSTSPVLS